MDTHYSLYTDGGSRGNPGPAAIGYVLYNPDGTILVQDKAYIGETTNNQAEYQALTAALKKVKELEIAGPLHCYLDSQLVVRQVTGIYKMKEELLRPWLNQIHSIISELPYKVTFEDIRREKNKLADSLVNQALDAQS